MRLVMTRFNDTFNSTPVSTDSAAIRSGVNSRCGHCSLRLKFTPCDTCNKTWPLLIRTDPALNTLIQLISKLQLIIFFSYSITARANEAFLFAEDLQELNFCCTWRVRPNDLPIKDKYWGNFPFAWMQSKMAYFCRSNNKWENLPLRPVFCYLS